ncbi:MAG: carboxypeptidase-like regulatory domain-containing protein [Parabacteroides sp.]
MNKKSETISSFRKKGNIMKKAGVICISAFLSTSVFAQITLDVKQQTIKQTLRTIEKATDYRFFYSNQLPDLNKTVSFEVNNQSIDATMNKLLNGTGLFYEKREDNQIYLAAKNARGEEKIIKISGTILDNNNEPIIGANVSIKGTTTGTITDIDGNFSLDVSTGMTLLVSYIGYATKEVPVGNQSVYKIIMTEDTQNLDEVVVVGYGTMKKSTVTGAISTMKADVIESIPVSNLSNALAGRLAGVNVTQSTGTPGISSKIRIRASGSWNSQDPIFVIDGVVRSKAAFDALDQSEVNEISMLKDAASTAIYGSRGGDGVVLVTTKQGRKGKPTLQYSGSVTIEHPTKILEFNDAVTHMNLTNFVFF